MKIKVIYRIPAVETSDIIEIGSVKNSELNKKQMDMVNKLVDESLRPMLLERFKNNFDVKIIIKALHNEL